MEKDVLLGIIMPTYNVEHYIVKTIKSVLEQDSDDYNLTIIDDCSTDNTVQLIKETFNREISKGKIKLIVLDSNSGPAVARQVGLNTLSTPYVTFLDADDTYRTSHAISFMVKAIKEYGPDFIMYKYVTDHGKIKLKKKYVLPTDRVLSSREAMIYKVNKPNPIWHYLWNKCYKTSVIKEYHINFHPELRMAEDVRFNDDFLVCAKNCLFVDKYLYTYNCCNYASVSHSKTGSVTKESLINQWNFECQNYNRLISNTEVLGCLNECQQALKTNLCKCAINIIYNSKYTPWHIEIEQLIKQSDYYKDICLMYDALLCKFRLQKKILKMKGRIKRWIFG